MINIKNFTPSDWLKIGAVVVAMVTTYNMVGYTSDKVTNHDKQLYWLQGSAKAQDTDIALIKQRQDMQDREAKALGEKLERDRAKSEELNKEINNTLSQLQVSIAKLNATMDQILENKKGR